MIAPRHPFAPAFKTVRLLPRRKFIPGRRANYTITSYPSTWRQCSVTSSDPPRLIQTKFFLCKRSVSQSASTNRTLYSRTGFSAFKCYIILEELGLRYDTVQIGRSEKVKEVPGFLDKNPGAYAPALRDGDVGVFGFGGILSYLIDRYDTSASLSYPRGTPEYYTMQSWFLAEIGRTKARISHVESPQGLIVSYDKSEKMIRHLNTRLSHVDWVAGDKYTMADIAIYSFARTTPALRELDLAGFPALERWVKRLEGRDAVQKAIHAQIHLSRKLGKDGKGGKGESDEETAPE